MPPKKRKGLPKKTKKKSNILFDFLDDITYSKKNILTKDNDHEYSKFMITRFLSMYEPYLPIVDTYLNRYQATMENEQFHKFCIAIIPKKKVYLKYINGSVCKKEATGQLKWIKEYFNISEDRAFEYYQIAGEELVTNIKEMYGVIE